MYKGENFMIKIKKIVDVLSWFIILILGLLLIVRWHEIDSNVIIHSGLFGDFSYGNKIFLVYILFTPVMIQKIDNMIHRHFNQISASTKI